MPAEGSAKTQPLDDPDLASQIIDNALDYAIVTMNSDGAILTWSRGAERIFGYTSAEAIGLNIEAIFTAPDLAADTHTIELQKAKIDGRAEDSRWHVRKNGERFWANGVTLTLTGSDALLKILRDETAMKLADEQRVLLLNELNHRIKNTLATVQSIAEQTLKASDVDPVARMDLTNRLIALSEAHNVLVEENWAGADLHTVVDKVIAPHQHPGASRFDVDGPAVRLNPHQAVAMSLALHELATNAIKHGALSLPDGRVRISWNLSQDGQGGRHLTLLWEEIGGPLVEPPRRKGFGSRLLARTFEQEKAGSAKVEYLPQGVRCVVELTLSTPLETTILAVGPAASDG
jgi:PAS domain S-box-containing protein